MKPAIMLIMLYSVVVLHDMDFNPQNDRQAEDRAHREWHFPLLYNHVYSYNNLLQVLVKHKMSLSTSL